jgi:uncharacterized protein
MPTRDDAPIGAPCWVDLMTTDPDASRKFYGEFFGWTAEESSPALGGYFNFQKNGVRVAGGFDSQPEAPVQNVWSIYLATDDAEKTVDAATANGGQVIVPAMAVVNAGETLGTMAVVSDVGGAVIGMWEPGTHRGFGVWAEAGAPSWFELHTRDYDKAVEFYRDVFRWPTHVAADEPDFRYTTYGEEDSAQAGIMDATTFLPDGVPAHWSVYFGVADTDAALAKTVELGGAIVVPATDTPYGRLATATDINGAVFKLVG